MSHPEDSKRSKPRFLTNIRVYLGKAIQEKSNTSSVLVKDGFIAICFMDDDRFYGFWCSVACLR